MASISSSKVEAAVEVMREKSLRSEDYFYHLYGTDIRKEMYNNADQYCSTPKSTVLHDEMNIFIGCLDTTELEVFSLSKVTDFLTGLGINIPYMIGRFFDWFYSTPLGILLTIVFVIFFIIYMSGIYFRCVSQIGIFFLSSFGFVWTYWALESRVILGNRGSDGYMYGEKSGSALLINLYTLAMIVMQIIHFQLLIECYQYYEELWDPNMLQYFGESVWNHPEVRSEVFVGFMNSYDLGLYNNGYAPLIVMTSLGVIWGYVRFFFPQRWLAMNTKVMGWVFMVIGAAAMLFSSKDYEDLIVRPGDW